LKCLAKKGAVGDHEIAGGKIRRNRISACPV
jgi:hypothetical protein